MAGSAEDRRYEGLSPFELKDRLVELATECTRLHARLLLDAGRGNPDWLALEPRAAFAELVRIAAPRCCARRSGMRPRAAHAHRSLLRSVAARPLTIAA